MTPSGEPSLNLSKHRKDVADAMARNKRCRSAAVALRRWQAACYGKVSSSEGFKQMPLSLRWLAADRKVLLIRVMQLHSKSFDRRFIYTNKQHASPRPCLEPRSSCLHLRVARGQTAMNRFRDDSSRHPFCAYCPRALCRLTAVSMLIDSTVQ